MAVNSGSYWRKGPLTTAAGAVGFHRIAFLGRGQETYAQLSRLRPAAIS